MYREIGDQAGVGECLQALFFYNNRLKKWPENMALSGEAATIFEELGLRQMYGISILNRGIAERKLGLLDAARRDLKSAREIFSVDDQKWIGNYYYGAAALEMLQGHFTQALDYMQKCVAYTRKSGFCNNFICNLAALAKLECQMELLTRLASTCAKGSPWRSKKTTWRAGTRACLRLPCCW